MSRPTGARMKPTLAILPPEGQRIRSMADAVGWEISERTQYVLVTNPDGKRITLHYKPSHPDWTTKIPVQVRSSGLEEAYAAHQGATQRKAEDSALASFLDGFIDTPEPEPEADTAVPEAVEPEADGGEFPCDVCGKTYFTLQGLGSHKAKVHAIKGSSRRSNQRHLANGDAPQIASPEAPVEASVEETASVTIPAPSQPTAPAATPADELKDVREVMQLLGDEISAALARVKENAPDPAVVQERDVLQAQVESLTGSLQGKEQQVAFSEVQIKDLQAKVDELQKDAEVRGAELQKLRDFWGFVLGLMDGNTAPNKAYNLISGRIIADAEQQQDSGE